MEMTDQEKQQAATPASVLQMLREGNYRFTGNLRKNRNLLEEVMRSRAGQFPLATVVNCIDSRTPTELLFDQGIGRLFGVRMAGSVISTEVLGSIEFATKVAGSKLVVLLGHTQCGAVKGACDNVQMGNLTALLEKIRPAVEAEQTVTADRTSKNPDFLAKVSEIHVRLSLALMLEKSEIVRDLIRDGEIALIGGMYNVENGTVDFYEDTYLHGQTDLPPAVKNDRSASSA